VGVAIAASAPDPILSITVATVVVVFVELIIARGALTMMEVRQAAGRGAAEARYRTLVESAPTAILVVSAQGHVLYANAVAAQLLGVSSAFDLLGIDMGDLLPTQGAVLKEEAQIESLIAGLLAGPGRQQAAQPARLTRLRTFRGDLIEVERTAVAIFYDGVPAVLMQGNDVTARVVAERDALNYQEQLRSLAAELVTTEDRERRQLATALHDRVGQALAVARLRLKQAQADGAAAGTDVDLAVTMVEDAISETRVLTTELAPPVLYELGLAEAVQNLCDELYELHGLSCTVHAELDETALDEAGRALLFRSVRELLMNALKHAESTEVSVVLSSGEGIVRVEVSDDGVGYDSGAVSKRSFGLMSVGESVRALGGALEVESHPGRGTRVQVTLPRSSRAVD
jgi:PAS domain S-box-containing protein